MLEKPSYWINSVDHALHLATLLHAEGPMSVTQAANRLDIGTSTAHRLLSMLVYRDFAVQDEHRVYHPGPLLALGPQSLAQIEILRQIALPHLVRLARELKASSYLGILVGPYCRFVTSIENPRAHNIAGNRDGIVLPAHHCAVGVAMLAQLPLSTLTKLYSDDRHDRGQETTPELADMEWQLHHVREQGVAVTAERAPLPTTGVGVALRTLEPTNHAGISVAVPSALYEATSTDDITRKLQDCARDIDADLARVRVRPAS